VYVLDLQEDDWLTFAALRGAVYRTQLHRSERAGTELTSLNAEVQR
jgi:hypothetical protein